MRRSKKRIPFLYNIRFFHTQKSGKDHPTTSLYDVLGLKTLDEKAHVVLSATDLRRAFIREASKHSLLNNTTALLELSNAYQILSNERKRSIYNCHQCSPPDATLGILLEGGLFANYNPEHQEYMFTRSSKRPHGDKTFGDYGESFRNVSGTPMGNDPLPFGDLPKPGFDRLDPVDGTNVNFTLSISFPESLTGCNKQITFKRDKACTPCKGTGRTLAPRKKCVQCFGRGIVELPSSSYVLRKECAYCLGIGSTLPPRCSFCRGVSVMLLDETTSVTVAAGTCSMSTWCVTHLGHEGRNGGATGNLFILCVVKDDKIFHRLGDDLHCALPISLSVALLGGVIDVPLPSAGGRSVPVRIPPGVDSGFTAKVDTGGVYNALSGYTGHVFVHIVVVIPKGRELSRTQRKVLGSFTLPRKQATLEEMAQLKEKHKHWFATTM